MKQIIIRVKDNHTEVADLFENENLSTVLVIDYGDTGVDKWDKFVDIEAGDGQKYQYDLGNNTVVTKEISNLVTMKGALRINPLAKLRDKKKDITRVEAFKTFRYSVQETVNAYGEGSGNRDDIIYPMFEDIQQLQGDVNGLREQHKEDMESLKNHTDSKVESLERKHKEDVEILVETDRRLSKRVDKNDAEISSIIQADSVQDKRLDAIEEDLPTRAKLDFVKGEVASLKVAIKTGDEEVKGELYDYKSKTNQRFNNVEGQASRDRSRIENLERDIVKKANESEVKEELLKKESIIDNDKKLAKKADKTELTAGLNKKMDKAQAQIELDKKADKVWVEKELETLVTGDVITGIQSELKNKVDKTAFDSEKERVNKELETKSNKAEVEYLTGLVSNKADKKDLDAKADKVYVDENLTSLEDRIDSLEGAEVGEIGEHIANIKEAKRLATEANEKASTANDTAETALSTAQRANTTGLNAQTAAIRAQSSANEAKKGVSTLNGRVDELNGNVSKNTEDIAALTPRVTKVEGNVSSIDTRLETAEGKVASTESKVSSLETKTSAVEKDLTDYKKEVSVNYATKANLSSEVVSVNNNINTTKQELNKSIEGVKGDVGKKADKSYVDAELKKKANLDSVLGTSNFKEVMGWVPPRQGYEDSVAVPSDFPRPYIISAVHSQPNNGGIITPAGKDLSYHLTPDRKKIVYKAETSDGAGGQVWFLLMKKL